MVLLFFPSLVPLQANRLLSVAFVYARKQAPERRWETGMKALS